MIRGQERGTSQEIALIVAPQMHPHGVVRRDHLQLRTASTYSSSHYSKTRDSTWFSMRGALPLFTASRFFCADVMRRWNQLDCPTQQCTSESV